MILNTGGRTDTVNFDILFYMLLALYVISQSNIGKMTKKVNEEIFN